MTAGTLHDRFASGPAATRSIHVGPNSKLVAGVSSIDTNDSLGVQLQMYALGTWLPISEVLNKVGRVEIYSELVGNVPAGVEIRLNIFGTYTDVNVFIMTS